MGESAKAAYIGVSNGNKPEFYSIFREAMSSISIGDCKMIRSGQHAEDVEFMLEADIILLAGGDPALGWSVLTDTGLKELVLTRYAEGATLVGVSAGAVQLGLYAVRKPRASYYELIDTFKLIPFVIDTHDDALNWTTLTGVVQLLGNDTAGIGIPRGGAMVYHSDQTVEAVRTPLVEITIKSGQPAQSLILPADK